MHLRIYSILLLMMVITYCNGQNKTPLPKLVKTQGTSEYVNVRCGLMDKAGNLWFGTTGEGVYRYDGKLFTQFTVKDGLNSNTVWSILEDKTGNLWFGTDNGICRYDGKTISTVPISLGSTGDLFFNTSPNTVSSEKNDVWSIMQDKSGTLWFGTKAGVYCYNGKSFSRFLDNKSIINKDGLTLKMVDCMLEDKNGIIWFGSGMPPGGEEGICRFDGKTLIGYKPGGNGWIRTIIEDKNGDLIIATRLKGVLRYNGKDFTNFTEKAGIDNAGVCTILKDKAGNIWMGTELGSGQIGEDGGVWRFDGKSFTKFTTKDGLIHNGVFCIVEDKLGNIWFGTRNVGLCRYDGKTFTHFSE